MSKVLGIDVGTSGTKAIVVDASGVVAGVGHGGYAPTMPRSGWSEQPPEDWWTGSQVAIQAACRDASCDPSEIEAIGLTGQMHGLVTLDASMCPIRPAILWNDGRSQSICDDVESELGIDRLLAATGNRMLAGFTAPKLLWMRKHEPDAYALVEKVLLPKDWIRWKLTGELSTDVSDASGTAVFDCEHRRWATDLLDELELPRSWWPDAAESIEVTGRVTDEVSTETGLRPGIPVVAGAGDQAASAVGTGLVREGMIGAALGTSGVIFAPTERWRPMADGNLHAFCHAVPGTWHLMGVMLSGAGSLDWFRSAVTPDLQDHPDAFAEIERLAAEVPAGAEGVMFMPYLSGERTPHADTDARGGFIGLDKRHHRGHLARAVFEGVTHGLADCLDLVRDADVRADVVRLSGGGVKSPLWRQLCADLFDLPVATTTTTEGTAYGAAILAAVGGGLGENLDATSRAWIHETSRIEPDEDGPRLLARRDAYRALYPALRRIFPLLHQS